ncbi:DUF456 domain-containing protein [Pseudonocardia pini]|uniref:DUF456 domain-containing protein n=1 Tax=Pseudonocardia pini TaxID=2758030 RepID=UPI0028AD39B1|nr:DUF456 domain-containing protein [Pseudonocardia pini]
MVLSLVAGLLIVVGLLGVISQVLPGLIVVLAGVAVWAIPRGDALGWWVFGIAAGLLVLGSVVKYLVPGKQLKDAGVPGRSLLLGAVLGIIGFFVIPVVGLFLGFVLGVYLAELARLGSSARAWPSTKHALRAVGWSILIELGAGLLMAGAWIAGLILA